MTDDTTSKALAIAECAVQEMAELGIDPMKRAIALAWHMQRQADLAMPTEETAQAFKMSLATG